MDDDVKIIDLPKPDIVKAIKAFVRNNYEGTLTGEAFGDLFKEIEFLRYQLAEADGWCEYWRRDAFRKYPTPESYEAACKALHKHKERADKAEQANTAMREALEWYANSSNYYEYSSQVKGGDPFEWERRHNIEEDNGKRAATILSRYPKEGETK